MGVWTTEKSRPSLFWPLAAIVIPLMGLLARIRIRGGEHLPRKGAFVLSPNHYSEIDPLIVAVAVYRMGRLPRFMGKESLFRVPVLGWILRSTGMIPVARGGSAASARQTLEQAAQLVEHGRGVVVYPEGSLTRDPEMWPMRGKSGAVRLALAGEIPLIPVAQWGTHQIMGRYSKKISLWPPRKKVEVLFGEPLDLSDLAGRAGEQAALNEGTERLMAAIAALLGELRGEEPPAERWNPAEHGQKETGRFDSETS